MDRISVLMDGECDGPQARLEIVRIRQHDELRRSWDTFHLIGDALRGERPLSPDFAGRLSARLAQEPTVLAPRLRFARRIAAYALSAAASLAAVAVVGWMAFSTNTATRSEVARAPAPTPVLAPMPAPAPQLASVPDEGVTNEYLLAHQVFSPSTAIQGVVPYIRSVSSSQPAKDR
jgi:sigma-E factor negative regulatory protein RseA